MTSPKEAPWDIVIPTYDNKPWTVQPCTREQYSRKLGLQVQYTAEPTYKDPHYNDRLVIMTTFQCTYDFPIPPIEIVSSYSKNLSNSPTFTTNISDAISIRIWRIYEVKKKRPNWPSEHDSSTHLHVTRLNPVPVKCRYLENFDDEELTKIQACLRGPVIIPFAPSKLIPVSIHL